MTDRQLLREIKKNPALFADVYDAHYQTIFNFCYRRTGDFDAARDISSETFLKAYLNVAKFKWRGVPILSWLYRIASNECNLFFRARKYRPELLGEAYGKETYLRASDSLEEERSLAEREWEQQEQFVAVQKALKTLSPKYQEVISLRFFEKMKIREIALVFDKKEGTIKSLLSRGLAQLREKL